MSLESLNSLDPDFANVQFTKCCGAEKWVNIMVAKRPYQSETEMLKAADKAWLVCVESDWLEAFKHHPKIGDVDSLAKKYANTKTWAGNEQQCVDTAARQVIERLAELNAQYEEKFGFIFIVCATGKSAEEMLEILESRIGNEYCEELEIAAGEQHKITVLRLTKLIETK